MWILLVLISAAASADITDGVSNVRWVSHALSEAMVGFAPTSKINTQCNSDSRLYLQALSNSTLWAVQMLDASSLAVGGLLSGDKYSLGHYDQCLAVQQGVRAQYCLATLQYGPSPKAFPSYYSPPKEVFREPPSSGPVWDKVKMTLDPEVSRRDLFHWALCVPASCTSQDLQESLNSTLDSVLGKYNLQGHVSVDPEFCQTRDKEVTFSAGHLVVRFIIYLLAVVTIVATTFDYITLYSKTSFQSKQIGTCVKILLAFSVRINMKDLSQQGSDPKLAIANGTKTLALMGVMFGHRFMYTCGTSLANLDFPEWVSERGFLESILINATYIVDIFFFCSGAFTFLIIYKVLETRKSLNFGLAVLYRWLRIVPPYLVMMGIVGWMLPRMSQGPLWTKRVGLEAERCQQNWWLNLLFINNYVHADNQCLLMSWYLACDMQLFVVGMLAIYVFWRWPKVGYALFALLLAASVAIPFYVTYQGRFYGAIKFSIAMFRDPINGPQMKEVYMKGYNRAAPYLIGILTAHFATRLLQANYKPSTRTILLGTLVFFGGGWAHQMYAFLFYQRERPYSVLENALYAGLHRVTFALILAWISGTFYLTLFEPFRVLLGQPFFAPFSKLMYCMVLVHPTLQLAHTASVRHSEFMEYPRLYWSAGGDFFISCLLALPLYLMVEGPSKHLVRILLLDGHIEAEQTSRFDIEPSHYATVTAEGFRERTDATHSSVIV